MAERPDGKSARTERVVFTRPAAERISRVVRTVEAGDRSAAALRFGRLATGGAAGQLFRVCTFTGSWAINSSKTVTFRNITATPNTVSVSNVLFPLPQLSSNTNSPTVCAIAKDGTSWYLISVVHALHTALTDVTLTSTNLQFSRRNVLSVSTTAAASSFAVTSCVTGQVSVQALSFFQ